MAAKTTERKLRAVKDEEKGVEIKIDADTGEVIGDNGKPSGKTLEQLAEEAAEEMPGFVKGSNPQLSLDVGGKPPTSSDLKIKAITIPLDGQFPKNKRVQFLIDVEVEQITVKTDRDKDGYVTGHTRVHTASINGIQKA